MMINIENERYRYPIPNRELERRWALIREAMAKQQLDCLIMQNDHPFLGGYVRYFTDVPTGGYGTTVVFPVDDEMIVINHGGAEGPHFPPEWAARGIKHRISRPYVQTLHYSNTFAAEEAVKFLKSTGYTRFGWLGLDMISASFFQYMKNAVPSAEWSDASDLVDEIKAVKSTDEIAAIRRTVAIHDYVAAAMPVIFRPGRYEFEIRNELKRIASDLECEEMNVVLGTDPVRPAMTPPIFENRRIEPGDQMVCLIEVNGPGGYYGELARCWSLGEPTQAQIKAFEVSLKAQQMIADMIRPGIAPKELLKANNDFLVRHGYAPEERLFGHGQGYDMVERPAFTFEETMVLKKDMLLAIHPTAINGEAFAFCCDNFLVTDSGVELLSKTPQEILTV